MNLILKLIFGLIFLPFFFLDCLGQEKVRSISVSDSVRFEENFQSRYQSKEYLYTLPKKPKLRNEGNLSFWAKVLGHIVEYALYISLVVAVVVVIKEMAKRININTKNTTVESPIKIMEGKDELNVSEENIDKLISDYKNVGDYRMALRYHFIMILKRMVARNIIKWDPDKTNTDYKYEIKSRALAEKFGQISSIYEYVWYGEFLLDSQRFAQAEILFLKLTSDITHMKSSE